MPESDGERRTILLSIPHRWLSLFLWIPVTPVITADGCPTGVTRMTAGRPRSFWRLTAPRAVILELARESSKKEYCFPIYPGPPTRQRAGLSALYYEPIHFILLPFAAY